MERRDFFRRALETGAKISAAAAVTTAAVADRSCEAAERSIENLREHVEALRGKCEEVVSSHEKFARATIGDINSLHKKYDSLERSQKKVARAMLIIATVSTGVDLYLLS